MPRRSARPQFSEPALQLVRKAVEMQITSSDLEEDVTRSVMRTPMPGSVTDDDMQAVADAINASGLDHQISYLLGALGMKKTTAILNSRNALDMFIKKVSKEDDGA